MSRISYQKYGISEAELEQIREYFRLFDPKETGRVNPNEIKKALNDMGEQMQNTTVYQQICTLCSEGRGSLTFQQFLPLMTSKILKHDPSASVQQLIDLLDDDKHGYISIQALRRAMESVNIEASEQTLQQMIKLADKDKDMMISVAQLKGLLEEIYKNRK